jgi:4-alpha-glucanotransferase
MTIIPMQDLLKLDNRARLNSPGTIGYPNWVWKMSSWKELKRIKFKIK